MTYAHGTDRSTPLRP